MKSRSRLDLLSLELLLSWKAADFYVSEINHPRHHAMVAGSFVLEGDVSICGLDENIRIGRIIYLVVNYYFPVKPMRCMVTLNNYPAIVPLTGRSKRLVGRRNIPIHRSH